jgi:hypothetical protein
MTLKTFMIASISTSHTVSSKHNTETSIIRELILP